MVFEHGRDGTAWNSQSCNLESLCSPVRCAQKDSLRDQRGSNGTEMSFPKNSRNPVSWVQPFITAEMDHADFRYMLKKINYIKLNDLWPSSPECKQNLEVLKFFQWKQEESLCRVHQSSPQWAEVWLPSGNPLKKLMLVSEWFLHFSTVAYNSLSSGTFSPGLLCLAPSHHWTCVPPANLWRRTCPFYPLPCRKVGVGHVKDM